MKTSIDACYCYDATKRWCLNERSHDSNHTRIEYIIVAMNAYLPAWLTILRFTN